MACSVVEKVQRSLERIEQGRYSELTLYECADRIDWLAKWKKVPEDIWVPLCEKCTELLDVETGYLKMKRGVR